VLISMGKAKPPRALRHPPTMWEEVSSRAQFNGIDASYEGIRGGIDQVRRWRSLGNGCMRTSVNSAGERSAFFLGISLSLGARFLTTFSVIASPLRVP